MPGHELINHEEKKWVNKVFENGGVLFRHGFENRRQNSYMVKNFEVNFAEAIGTNYALAVTSGTAALRVALASLNLPKNSKVITQSFTFVATVEAIIEANLTPVCTEIDETLNMDVDDLISKIDEETKAVIVVHMLGTPARVEQIKKVCDENNLILIEDVAWGCGGSLNSKMLGTWGDVSAFSFDYAKAITTGEGGMICTNNKSIYEKALAWHDHGHENNPLLPRWEDSRSSSGFNFRMMELQGAIGIAQLMKLDEIVSRQRLCAQTFWDSISDLTCISKRVCPPGSYETNDALVIQMLSPNHAKKLRRLLLECQIGTKILPEAMTWHFAKYWSHITELTNQVDFSKDEFLKKSEDILQKCVAIPTSVFGTNGSENDLREAVLLATSNDA